MMGTYDRALCTDELRMRDSIFGRFANGFGRAISDVSRGVGVMLFIGFGRIAIR